MALKKDVIKAEALPRNFVSEALSLNPDEAIIIPVNERRKVLAALHYYTQRIGSHKGFKFKTKAVPEKPGQVYLLRLPPTKKKKVITKKAAALSRR